MCCTPGCKLPPLLASIKHRMSNTGWMIKWLWREGVERSASPNIERMLNNFNLHLSALDEKAVSRICTSKTRRNLQHLAGAYNSNSHTRRLLLSYFWMRKQAEKSIQRCESFKEFVSEKFSIMDPLWRRRNPCNLWSHWHCCQKTTRLWRWRRIEKGAGEKGKSVTTSS